MNRHFTEVVSCSASDFVYPSDLFHIRVSFVPETTNLIDKRNGASRCNAEALGRSHHLDALFIISAAADLPDKAAATDRLLQNQVDIGNAIKPYYGDAAGDKLTTLLKEHITTAAEIVTAAKAADKAKQDDATKRWFANADQIADFLSKANPKNWPQAEMRKMMRDHLNLTTEEVVARLQGNWAADIAAFDKIHAQILHMADMLTAGIVKQHPAKLK